MIGPERVVFGQVEEGLSPGEITDEEWQLIEERAAGRDLAADGEVKAVFAKYRGA